MNFKDATAYTHSQIKTIAQSYEISQKFLLTERKVRTVSKISFKLICVKGVQSSCPFRLSFNLIEDGMFEYRESNSVLRHNHGKSSKKAFQTKFFKRDFKFIENPLRNALESNYQKLKNLKPKTLLKVLKEQKLLTSNILKGFSLYHRIFKKKFDNLVRKIKESLKKDVNDLSVQSGFSTEFESSVKQESTEDEIFKEEEKDEEYKVKLEEKEEKIENEDAKSQESFHLELEDFFVDEFEKTQWIVPFNFY